MNFYSQNFKDLQQVEGLTETQTKMFYTIHEIFRWEFAVPYDERYIEKLKSPMHRRRLRSINRIIISDFDYSIKPVTYPKVDLITKALINLFGLGCKLYKYRFDRFAAKLVDLALDAKGVDRQLRERIRSFAQKFPDQAIDAVWACSELKHWTLE
jgi:hypothetical protein